MFAIAGVAGVPGRNDGARADCTIECAAPAKLNSPIGVAVDNAGNVYVADEGNNKVRMISQGAVSTVDAGTLLRPTGVAVSAVGDLYVADYGNHRIQRRLAVDACSLQTVAGTGRAGRHEGADATSAELNSPVGITIDGNSLYIADFLNQRIRKVDFTPILFQ
jgi:DNA-binding beta-propeller fold protein YncE